MPYVTAGGNFFPRGHCNLVALLKHLWITKLRSSVILLLPLFTITMPNVTAGGIFFPRGHCNLVALLKHLWITKLRSSVILLIPLFTIAMPNVTAGGIFFPRGHCNLVALLKHLWITKLRSLPSCNDLGEKISTSSDIGMVIVNKVNNKITELLNFVIHKCLSKATKLQWPRGKKIPPAVTLGMAIVNKGINTIHAQCHCWWNFFSTRSLQLGSFT
jgi:hypothetical protein